MDKRSQRISENDVLRRLLKTPPKPHSALKKRASKAASDDPAVSAENASGKKRKPVS
jgi:hypothetical protein